MSPSSAPLQIPHRARAGLKNAMSDLPALTREILAFRDARDWQQFHTPRNLAAALAIEAAELQELMLWKTDQEVEELLGGEKHQRVKEELADVLIFALLFAHETGVDPVEAIRGKLERNEERYPEDLSRGRADKYSDLNEDSHGRG